MKVFKNLSTAHYMLTGLGINAFSQLSQILNTKGPDALDGVTFLQIAVFVLGLFVQTIHTMGAKFSRSPNEALRTPTINYDPAALDRRKPAPDWDSSPVQVRKPVITSEPVVRDRPIRKTKAEQVIDDYGVESIPWESVSSDPRVTDDMMKTIFNTINLKDKSK